MPNQVNYTGYSRKESETQQRQSDIQFMRSNEQAEHINLFINVAYIYITWITPSCSKWKKHIKRRKTHNLSNKNLPVCFLITNRDTCNMPNWLLSAPGPMILWAASEHKSHNEKQTSSPAAATTKPPLTTHGRLVCSLRQEEGERREKGKRPRCGKGPRGASLGLPFLTDQNEGLKECSALQVSYQWCRLNWV